PKPEEGLRVVGFSEGYPTVLLWSWEGDGEGKETGWKSSAQVINCENPLIIERLPRILCYIVMPVPPLMTEKES
ncbi:hypothetical protein ACQP3J_29795, partial [Escherichia coli]